MKIKILPIKTLLLYLCLCSFESNIHAQAKEDQIMIDTNGIMRWRADNSELTGFGVNYTVPFAYAYRNGKKMDIDLKAAIDQDVYHFSRLGLDLFRVHVWDCEISDTLGNLMQNEHLELFDYLLYKLNERGIRSVITPIAYWGDGWPERDGPTPGFSTKYGKDGCLTNPDAIKAQENYLKQFVSHVSSYRNIAYKDDPMVIAFEVCNEPHHRGAPEDVTSFVQKMKNAIRSSGCTKPIFYNVTHGINYAENYFAAGIDGGTFQWYPTGLGFQKELGGNMLPNVDSYSIPFDDVLKKNGAARFVYEFDAADMASTYMYPAMARSFRTAGMQLGAHFSYDPTYLAPYNTEYNTHYMNLVYAPRKALSLMITAEVFRTIPLYQDYGVYPGNTTFGPFRVSYESDLAEMVTDEKFIYTNHTDTHIKSPEKLKLIAGYGNSQLIKYEGTGAYFLDKLGDGIWRLELMPDATIVDNLFGWNDLTKTRAVISYAKRKMKINIPEFSNGYSMESVDWRDSIIYRQVRDEAVEINPGIYLLLGPQYFQADSVTYSSKRKLKLDEFYAPPSTLKEAPIAYKSRRKSVLAPDWKFILKPFTLFEPKRDSALVNRPWVSGSKVLGPTASDSISYLYIPLDGLVDVDGENPNAVPLGDYTMRYYFGDIIETVRYDLVSKKSLTLNAYTNNDLSFPIQVSLVMKDGTAFGRIIRIDSNNRKHSVLLREFERIKPVIIPRPYPTFLPYYSEAGKCEKLDLTKIESLQISIGPGIPKEDWNKKYEVVIGRIQLE